MGEIDPTKPQVNDPEVEAELIRVLSIVGPLGKLDVIPAVLPIISMGNVVQQTVEVRSPNFRSTDIFSAGIVTGGAAGTVHADTTALQAGTYDMIYVISPTATTGPEWQVQHRNAANAANLAQVRHITVPGATAPIIMTLAYEFALNERLRILNGLVMAGGEVSNATIFARRRV